MKKLITAMVLLTIMVSCNKIPQPKFLTARDYWVGTYKPTTGGQYTKYWEAVVDTSGKITMYDNNGVQTYVIDSIGFPMPKKTDINVQDTFNIHGVSGIAQITTFTEGWSAGTNGMWVQWNDSTGVTKYFGANKVK